MDYQNLYKDLVKKHLGREPKPDEGKTNEEISLTEKQLGFRLPQSLRQFYLTAGNLPEITEYHNHLYKISGLKIEGDFLVFMVENQAVVYWGIKLSDVGNSDPEVWQAANCYDEYFDDELEEYPAEWYSEELSFSQFIVKMMDWQFGLSEGE